MKSYREFVRMSCKNLGPWNCSAHESRIYGCALELIGEAGEVMEILQKASRDRGGRLTPEDRENLVDELGDVLWGVTAMADLLKVGPGQLAAANRKKLEKRIAARARAITPE